MRMQSESGPPAQQADVAAAHAAWLARQYGAFERRLLALLAGPSATLQVGQVSCLFKIHGAFDAAHSAAPNPSYHTLCCRRWQHCQQSWPW